LVKWLALKTSSAGADDVTGSDIVDMRHENAAHIIA
jgi:hypothetical protein